jgi:uncharacterized membrane protein required for colicin V production
MNPFDMLIITILTYGLIRGIFRGLVREISSIVGVLGGFYAAYSYYPYVARLISPWISNPVYLNIVSYMAIFSVVVIIVGILSVMIKYLLNIAYLGWVDRVCGALFGGNKGRTGQLRPVYRFNRFFAQGGAADQKCNPCPPCIKGFRSYGEGTFKRYEKQFRFEN